MHLCEVYKWVYNAIRRERMQIPCSGNKNESCGGDIGIEWYRLKSPCLRGKKLLVLISQSLVVVSGRKCMLWFD